MRPLDERVTPAQALSRVSELEAAHDLFRLDVEGWSAWALLRYAVTAAMAYPSMAAGGTPSPGSRLRQALGSLTEVARLRPAKVLVKTYSTARGDLVDGKYKDVYFDDLLIALGSFSKIESVNHLAFAERSRRAWVPTDLNTSGLELSAGLLGRIKPPRDAERVAGELAAFIRGPLGVDGFGQAFITRHLAHFAWSKRLHAMLLRRVRPEIVMIADNFDFPLVAAAKEAGVPTVELQHGVLDRFHAGYAWPASLAGKRERLPLVDYVFTYGRHWGDVLDQLPFWRGRVRNVGSLRMDAYRRLPIQRPAGSFTVLCTTQGVDGAALAEFLCRFMVLARPHLPVRLVVKVHPVYDGDMAVYRAVLAGQPDVSVLQASEGVPTIELLKSSHLHVSISSACHFEALALGTPTAIVPFAHCEDVMAIHEAGHAPITATPEALVALALQLNKEPSAVSESTSDYYFRLNALSHMKQAISELTETVGKGWA